jgi:hypothetical protein
MKLGEGICRPSATTPWAAIAPATGAGAACIAISQPRAAALGVLGVAEDRTAVAAAVGWNAADLEEAIIAAKGAGGMVRTQAEWKQHVQAASHRCPR